MNQPLEFTDCPNCGKRVRTTAQQCHHCHQALSVSVGRNKRKPIHSQLHPEHAEDQQTEHGALEHGGYDDHDDFDYENYLAEEFPDQTDRKPKPSVPRWVWVTAWILVVATLLPLMIQFAMTR